MTELMDASHLRQMAGLSDQSKLGLRPVVPVLRWTINGETGRPVSHWLLAEKQAAPDLSLPAYQPIAGDQKGCQWRSVG